MVSRKNLIDNDQFILHFASSAAGRSWSLSLGFDGMGDRVSQSQLHVQRSAIAQFIDVQTFFSRLKEIAASTKSPDVAAFVAAFLLAWENSKDHDFERQDESPPAKVAVGLEAVPAEPAGMDQPDPEE